MNDSEEFFKNIENNFKESNNENDEDDECSFLVFDEFILDLIISKKTLNIKDVYEMQQFYQSQISDECLVKQLYELSLKNDKLKISSLKTISPFLENSINQLMIDVGLLINRPTNKE